MTRLQKSFEHAFCGLLAQPLDAIAEYFGEDVAFYFAWLAFYTNWLVAPALLGIVCFAFQLHAGRLDHWICIPYSIFVMVWASFMLAYWRQHASSLAYKWGVLEYEAEETERPQFTGIYHPS